MNSAQLFGRFVTKSLFVLLLLLCCSAIPGAAAGISVKQHPSACGDSGTANSQKCSFASATTVGNFIWVSASAYPGNSSQNPACTVSDDGHDTFAAATNNGQHTSGGGWIYIWGAKVATAGAGVTVACTPASGSTMFITLDIFELTVGTPATWTFPDKGNGATAISGTTLSVTSFTPSSSSEIVLAAGTNDNNQSFSAGTNFTLGSSVITGQSLATEYWVQGSATATTAPITQAGSNGWAEVASSASAASTATPSISSLSPTSGPAGTSVTITGTNFGATQGSSTVAFNGTAGTPTAWSNTSISVPVPNGATTGNVVVTVGGAASNGVSFTPTLGIGSASPTSGPVGASVTLSGTGFGATKGSSTVTFNGTTATPTSWSNGSIVAPVPSAATSGNVVVTVGGTASNGVSFTVTPAISSLSPTSGPAGTAVTITGTNFGATQGTSTVSFNGTAATPTSWSNTSISVPVPNGATSGNVVVTVNGAASNGVSFTATLGLSSESPTSGPVGASVTLHGTGFGATQGTSTVSFNGTTGTPTSWSNGTIVVPAPGGATTGNVVVIVGGISTNGLAFTVTPGISSLSPTSGPGGTSVTITGTNFGATQGTSTVTFNGTAGTPAAWSNTSISVPVPNGATAGNVVVMAGGKASNGVNFTPTLGISSASPTKGPIGSNITINGTGFGSSWGTSTVTINGAAATPSSWSAGSIVAPVPTAASFGSGSLVVNVGGTASNAVGFIVIPTATNPAPTLTFNVNTSADTVDASPGDSICADSQGNCSVRAAVMESNASLAAGITQSVTISIPAGIYTLTIPGIDGSNASTGHLDITAGPVSIVGASASTTIIQAGTSVNGAGIPNGIDKVFSINPGGAFTGFDTSISNVTIRYGLNISTFNPFGGAFDWDAGTDGSGTLSITNCVIANNATVITDNTLTNLADGGGVALTNEVPNPAQEGTITITGSVIQNNIAQDTGGGIFEGSFPMTISNTQILSNQAVDSPGTQGIGQSGGQQTGGGLSISGPTVGHQTVIQNSTINQNSAGAQGGGIFTTAGVQITSDVISGNHAAATGGGLFSNTISETTQVVGTNITQNSAGGDGGGIEVDNSTTGNSLTMSFNRVVGNTAVAGNGLNNISGAVTATDNWWGCNQGPASTACDLINNTGTATFNPWIILTHTPSPTLISVGGNSTLTASLLTDSSGATPPSPNLSAFTGLPVSFQNAVNGTLSNIQPSIQPNGTATATFTANPGTSGSADAVVDNARVTANVNIQDFSLSLAPASQPVVRGGSVNYTLTVTPANSFTGTVSFTCSVSPANAGVTLTGCPNPVTLNGAQVNATITATASLSATIQNYTINVTGTNTNVSSDTHTASSTLNVTDFSVSISPSTLAAIQGSTATFTVTVSPNNGFTGQVNIACSFSPTGPVQSGCPASVNITGPAVSFNVTINTQSLAAQSYTFTVQGTSNTVPSDVHSGSATLNIQDFSLSLAPASQAVVRGGTATYTLTVTPLDGFTGVVNIGCGVVPAAQGVTIGNCPGPLTITSGAATATITVNVSLSATIQNYTINVTGTSASVPSDSHTASATLQVTDFQVSVSPTSQGVTVGNTASFTATVSPQNGFTGQVNITCSFSPAGPTIQSPGCPASVNITSGAVNFTITAGTTGLALQAYTLTVKGTSNVVPADVQNGSATLNVQNFSLSLSPTSQTVVRGGSVNYVVTVTPQNGFTGAVSLACSITPSGAGVTVSSCPSPVTITSGPATATITVSASSTATLQTYTVNVSGTVGNTTNGASASLIVQDFSVSVSPSSQTVDTGANTTYTVTVSSQNGFAATVSLSCSAAPAGLTVSCSPSSVNVPANGSVTSTMTVSVPGSLGAGNFTATATGTVGAFSRSGTAGVVTQVPTPGTGTVTVSGYAGCSPDGSVCDSGLLSVTVNGFTDSIPYNPDVDPIFHASYLRNTINIDNPYVTASCPPAVGQQTCPTGTIILTAKTAGPGTNYSLSVSSSPYDPTDFPQPGVTLSASGPTLTGGH
jgi:IPT/TIG domain